MNLEILIQSRMAAEVCVDHHMPDFSSPSSPHCELLGQIRSFVEGAAAGGSIRQPAHFCGVVGIKPTYGRVSRAGLVAYGSSLDCVGPLARGVEDAALVLAAIAGAQGPGAAVVEHRVQTERAV